MTEKTLTIKNAGIIITFDDKTGEILEATVVIDGGFMAAYPLKDGIRLKINPLGDGWRKHISPEA